MINLDSYTALRSALFVRIQIDEYRTSPSASYVNEVLNFSDHNANYVINGETYQNIGNLLNISSSTSELRATPDNITIGIAGIPLASVSEIIHSKIKSAPVTIYRGYFTTAGTLIGSIQGYFTGFIDNYSLSEDIDFVAKNGTISIQLECTSNLGILSNKIAGRRTNPISMKKYYSTDTSFDNVPALENTTFMFGGS